MKQPYIYTLPEQFIKDIEVPTRWRVWAVINGFFISGKMCWASNEWIGEQVKAHKDSVSQAVKELEKMGLLVCKRTARTRLISPTDPMIGGTAYLDRRQHLSHDRHERLPISDSTSDSSNSFSAEAQKNEEERELTRELDEDADRSKRRVPPDKNCAAIVEWAEKRTGRRFPNKSKQLGMVKNMITLGYAADAIKKKWEELENDEFWSERGIDFGVVSSNIAKVKKEREVLDFRTKK